MLGVLLDRIKLADLFGASGDTYVIQSRPIDGHYFLEPVLITARSKYEANREFDVSYPDRVRMSTTN